MTKRLNGTKPSWFLQLKRTGCKLRYRKKTSASSWSKVDKALIWWGLPRWPLSKQQFFYCGNQTQTMQSKGTWCTGNVQYSLGNSDDHYQNCKFGSIKLYFNHRPWGQDKVAQFWLLCLGSGQNVRLPISTDFYPIVSLDQLFDYRGFVSSATHVYCFYQCHAKRALILECHRCFDEGGIAKKAQYNLVRQYNSSKPDKYHIDFFALVTALEGKNSLYHLDAYHSRNDNIAHIIKEASELPKTQKAYVNEVGSVMLLYWNPFPAVPCGLVFGFLAT